MNDSSIRDTFSHSVAPFIHHLLTTQNDVHTMSHLILIVGIVFALIVEWIQFISEGVNTQRWIINLLFILSALVLSSDYLAPIETTWHAIDGLSLSFLQTVTGNNDPLFLSKWIDDRLMRLITDDVSILTDPIHLIVLTTLWHICAFLIEITLYLAGVWALWGKVLIELLGLVFVPCLAWSSLRPFFDVYVRLYFGFLMLLIMLRATSALAAITINAEFSTLGLGCHGQFRCLLTGATPIALTNHLELLVVMVLCVALVLSSFKMAYHFAQSCGAASNGAIQIAKKAAMMLAAL